MAFKENEQMMDELLGELQVIQEEWVNADEWRLCDNAQDLPVFVEDSIRSIRAILLRRLGIACKKCNGLGIRLDSFKRWIECSRCAGSHLR